ncbi:DUF3105 domain-containing protein [Haloarcula marismortui]|uniref:DUF3105 domain-containing protein n=1 Tax=Haloarcula marismortui ATCC 33800 TaxID=662476 RepID=M0K1K9_9EURY|nr:DUF3105 domain-containing protein [Haloarcula sinaiiensis]EMA14673.1 hypothetical protein C436_05561 [Haloarcula sinaiiensis ATCC 33800]QUJ71918.1 DUF3105 domain-containing protein [Haloarcula sinaiiensis ATCC 33800]
MVDCEYCGESFDGDNAYLDHLADAHDGELGAIDRRRVEEHTGGEEGNALPVGPIVIGVVVVLAIGLTVYVTQLSGGDGGSGSDADLVGTTGAQPLSAVEATGVEASSLDDTGDSDRLSSVEQFPDRGNNHVEEGSAIDYQRVPPLSGTHYASTEDAGFYEATPLLGSLVHTLEHGAVIVYYDPDEISPEARQSLREFSSVHTGTWRSVVAVPNPNDDPRATYVVTAWRHELTMDSYDAETVHAFLSEYLGRGPENPVR